MKRLLALVHSLAFASILSTAAAEFPPSATGTEIAALVNAVNRQHPRLLAGPGELEELRDRVANSAHLRPLAEVIRGDAESMLKVAPIKRELVGRRLLGESRRAVRRLLTLATAYHLTGQRVFAERAAREMLAIAAFTDWNPSHFLDVGEMTFAMAIGYDWLYGQLDEATRGTIRDAIRRKGVRVPLDTKHNGWTRASNNWGQVCHAGMVAGALAVLENDRETAVITVQRALENVPRSMAAFAPKGSYPEGPGYWAYGTTYNVLLIALLESVLGQNFGLDQAPGFDQTGAYLALTTGPSGKTFNYADGGSTRRAEPAVHWFAKRYLRPDWLQGELTALNARLRQTPDGTSDSDRFLPLTILWAGSAEIGDSRLPLHWTSDDKAPVALHRSSWSDPNAVFVGLKAGSPSGPHGHMDIGSFVLDADGVRWAVDLGAENYHRIESRGMNFWSMAQNSQRWTVFRQSNLSHNTLVIDGQLQRASGHAGIVRFSDTAEFPHSVVEMSAVHAGQAKSAHRGIALLPDGAVLVRDHLTGLKPGASVRWSMVTPGAPGAPGGASLELRQEKATLVLNIVAPAAAVWELVDTATPKHEWDSPNPGTVMTAFTVRAPLNGELNLTVVLAPGGRAVQLPAIAHRSPLEWSSIRK